MIIESNSADQIFADIKAKDVRSVDLFTLASFFETFSGVAYRNLKTLSQYYELLCEAKLSSEKPLTEAERSASISQVASTAFDILISRKKDFIQIKGGDVASLISNHSSVTNYLVARHVVDVLCSTKDNKSLSYINSKLNYVFPAEVNTFTKQMMHSNRQIETTVVDFIVRSRRMKNLGVLPRVHVAYLAGRVSSANRPAMVEFLADQTNRLPKNEAGLDRESRMLRRTIFISRSLIEDHSAELEYVDTLLTDVEEAEFNRGFHLEYYGDAPFEPDGKMSSRDDGGRSCNRTFDRLMDRILSPRHRAPVIELLTLLSLVQVRHAVGNLRIEHREATIKLLEQDWIKNGTSWPPKVKGYIRRMREDLEQGSFDLATVLQEWEYLPQTPRTGWLRRQRDAKGEHRGFWEGQRIESVAEHVWSALGIAETFLHSKPQGP